MLWQKWARKSRWFLWWGLAKRKLGGEILWESCEGEISHETTEHRDEREEMEMKRWWKRGNCGERQAWGGSKGVSWKENSGQTRKGWTKSSAYWALWKCEVYSLSKWAPWSSLLVASIVICCCWQNVTRPCLGADTGHLNQPFLFLCKRALFCARNTDQGMAMVIMAFSTLVNAIPTTK